MLSLLLFLPAMPSPFYEVSTLPWGAYPRTEERMTNAEVIVNAIAKELEFYNGEEQDIERLVESKAEDIYSGCFVGVVISTSRCTRNMSSSLFSRFPFREDHCIKCSFYLRGQDRVVTVCIGIYIYLPKATIGRREDDMIHVRMFGVDCSLSLEDVKKLVE
jgi:hypothetical protein